MHVSDLPFSTPLAKAFVESGKELGYREVDLNSADDTGEKSKLLCRLCDFFYN